MEENPKNALSNLCMGVTREDLEEFRARKREEEAWLGRLNERARRVAEISARLEKDDLAYRFAWTLLQLQERKKTARHNQRLIDQLREENVISKGKGAGYREAAKEFGRALEKSRLDRKRGPEVRLANDPKQSAKAEAKKLWQERYTGMQPKLRTNEQFAAEVMRRWPILKSSAVICGWCTEWNKEAKLKKPVI